MKISTRFSISYPDENVLYELTIDELSKLRPCAGTVINGKVPKITKEQTSKVKPLLRSEVIYAEVLLDEDTKKLTDIFGGLFMNVKLKSCGLKAGDILGLRYDDGDQDIEPYHFFESE